MADNIPQPPALPWTKGDHGSYSMVKVEVEVCRDEFGRVYTLHRLQDETDRETVMKWPSGGQEQIAFALLLEAVRREAVLGVLLELTKDKEFLSQLDGLPNKGEVLTGLAERVQTQMDRTIRRVSSNVVAEMIQQMQS
jgi:hypothetical protein